MNHPHLRDVMGFRSSILRTFARALPAGKMALKPGRHCKKPTLGRENTPKTRPSLQKTFTWPGKHPQNPAVIAKNLHSAGKTPLKPGRPLQKRPAEQRRTIFRSRPARRFAPPHLQPSHPGALRLPFMQPSLPRRFAPTASAWRPTRTLGGSLGTHYVSAGCKRFQSKTGGVFATC